MIPTHFGVGELHRLPKAAKESMEKRRFFVWVVWLDLCSALGTPGKVNVLTSGH
jgi:hypothetical protein